MANVSISEDRRENLLNACLKELHTCLEYVNKYSDNVEGHTNILKELAKDYCEIDAEHERIKNAQKATDQHFQNEVDCTDNVKEVFQKCLEEQPVVGYEKNSIWLKMTGADTQEDDEVEMSEGNANTSAVEEGIVPTEFRPPIDPITKKPIRDPCRSNKCGHVYEYDVIMQHLQQDRISNVKHRCPYIGCTSKHMKIKNITKDVALKEQIQKYNNSLVENPQDDQGEIL